MAQSTEAFGRYDKFFWFGGEFYWRRGSVGSERDAGR